jgi:hypothetical protein
LSKKDIFETPVTDRNPRRTLSGVPAMRKLQSATLSSQRMRDMESSPMSQASKPKPALSQIEVDVPITVGHSKHKSTLSNVIYNSENFEMNSNYER